MTDTNQQALLDDHLHLIIGGTGDQTFFVRADEVELAWRILDPLLQQPPPVHPYPAATWGPAAAGKLLAQGEWYDQPRSA